MSDTKDGPGRGNRGVEFWLSHALPFARYIVNRFAEDRGWRMAAGLSYTSLLAIVPLTAIAFSMLAAFPVFENVRGQFQDAVFANLLPQSANAMRDYFDQFIGNTTSLSAVGIVALALTAVLLLGTIEADLNSIFRVDRPRPLASRLLVFWAMITLGPLLLGASFSLSTYFFAATEWMGVDILKGLLGALTQFVPTLIIIVLLVLFYFTIPNRPVQVLSACAGGITAGLLFAALRKVFGWYVATFPTYQSIYGALSVIPIFLIWMYLSWTVVLMGAVMTASVSEWRRSGGRPLIGELRAGPRLLLALRVLAMLNDASQVGERVTRRRFLSDLGSGEEAVDRILLMLRDGHFVERAERNGWVLSRDIDTATLYDLYKALGLALRDDDVEIAGVTGWEAELRHRLKELQKAQQGATNVSLKSVLTEVPSAENAEAAE
ncbi:MAG: YihY family inner membrane protein [Magnetovibrio sp.]|nr:YihY family inner membrane protein [Magnetovibrio sp.]